MKWITKIIHIDVIIGSLFVFGLLYTVNIVSTYVNTDIIDPIGQALDNFQLTDLVYTAMRDDLPKDTNITIVNIGNLSRSEIGVLINNLNLHQPKVIGIDTRFLKDKSTYYKENGLEDGDSVLAQSFAHTKNLVLVSDMPRDSLGNVEEIITSHPKFMKNANSAYANMITKENEFRVARDILPKEMVFGKREIFFPVKIAAYFDYKKTQRFIDRNKELEIIYYRGNINNFDGERDPFGYGDSFNKIDIKEGMENSFDPKLVTGKMLMLGYMGSTIKNNKYWDEDKFYTPLNKKYAGKSYPDMYGVIVHANVLSMIINETYVNGLNASTSMIINLLLCLLGVIIFSYIHHNIHLWWDGLSVIIMLAMAVMVVVFKLYIFLYYRIEVDINLSLVFLFVLGNFLELYYEYAKPMLVWVLNRSSIVMKFAKINK